MEFDDNPEHFVVASALSQVTIPPAEETRGQGSEGQGGKDVTTSQGGEGGCYLEG